MQLQSKVLRSWFVVGSIIVKRPIFVHVRILPISQVPPAKPEA